MDFTSAINGTTRSVTGFTPVLSGVFVILIVTTLIITPILSYLIFLKYVRWLRYLGRSIIYAIKGGLVAITGYGIYFLSNWVGQTGIFHWEWLLYGGIGYIGLVGLGYLADKIFGRYLIYLKSLKKTKRKFK